MNADLVPGEHYLYLIEFPGLGVKVGISRTPSRRLAQHRRDAAAYDRKVGREWVSPVPHGNARENERTIKGASKREYLRRSFDECVTEASMLPMTRLDASEVKARSEAVLSLFKSFVTGEAFR